MTNQVKQFFIGDEVQFLGDSYKVVELLDSGESVHIKKTSPPGNSMVVPRSKLAGEQEEVPVVVLPEEDYVPQDFDDIQVINPDLLYRPDDRITLSVEISPEVQAVLDEIKKEE